MVNNFLLQFKQSYIVVIVAMVVACLFVFIDARITKKKVERNTYIKTALGTGLISTFIVYVNTMKGKVEEEIMSGAPPF